MLAFASLPTIWPIVPLPLGTSEDVKIIALLGFIWTLRLRVVTCDRMVTGLFRDLAYIRMTRLLGRLLIWLTPISALVGTRRQFSLWVMPTPWITEWFMSVTPCLRLAVILTIRRT